MATTTPPPEPGAEQSDSQDTCVKECIKIDSPIEPTTVNIALPAKVARIAFDPHGDVTLVLTTSSGDAHFQINSQVLCLASSVFRAMLGIKSCFKESHELAIRRGSFGEAPPVEISLADDDPHALAVVLRIVHAQHEYVPTSLKPERLYKIAILCDKYDMRACLALWLEKWLPKSFSGPALSLDKWLFMSYVFLNELEFKRLTREAILNISIDAQGNPQVTSLSENWSSSAAFIDYIPQLVLAEMLAIRQQTIEAMIDKAHEQIESYTVNDSVHCSFENKTCDAIVLGVLSKGLRHLGLYPEASSLMDSSVEAVKKLIDSLTYPSYVFLDLPIANAGCCGSPSPHKCSSSTCTQCGNCSGTYKAISYMSTTNNHSSCGPVSKFQTEVEEMVNKIEGLDCSRFVRNYAGNKSGGPSLPTDLWLCLEYK